MIFCSTSSISTSFLALIFINMIKLCCHEKLKRRKTREINGLFRGEKRVLIKTYGQLRIAFAAQRHRRGLQQKKLPRFARNGFLLSACACKHATRPIKKASTYVPASFAVGKTGFEPATPWSQTRCATGLRYFPSGSKCTYCQAKPGNSADLLPTFRYEKAPAYRPRPWINRPFKPGLQRQAPITRNQPSIQTHTGTDHRKRPNARRKSDRYPRLRDQKNRTRLPDPYRTHRF